MYQHYTQRAYLERWKVGGVFFLFEKEHGACAPQQKTSAGKIFGLDDWQSMDLENAFADVEQCVGHIDAVGEVTEAEKMRLLSRWLALHAVRNGLNAPDIAKINYGGEVDRLAAHFEGHFGFWQEFQVNSLITGDNPVVWMKHEATTADFYIAPVSPKRCVYLMPDDRIFQRNGKPLFQAVEINQFVYRAATKFCVSFDADLHLPA